MADVDVIVIGAGVVGLAVAAALGRDDRSVFVIERATSFGQGTSSRNSEVIHSGIYYPTGSLKARLSVAGNRRLHALGEAGQVPVRPLGKLIIAHDDHDLPALEGLLATGHDNGVPDLQLVDATDVRLLEPNIAAVGAILVPSTGVIDAFGLMRFLQGQATDRGVQLVYSAEVLAAEPGAGGYAVRIRDSSGEEHVLTSRAVVNSAGLSADRIAASVGIDVDGAGYRLELVKGNYAQVINGKNRLISHLIYPPPVYHGVVSGAGAGAFSGLGVHATLSVDGRMRLGPDVDYRPDQQEEYSVRPGLERDFFESARRYLPFLEPDDVVPESSGIRPKRVVARQGFADFVVAEESERGFPGWINLIGIESPGLTCSLEIGSLVARLLDEFEGS